MWLPTDELIIVGEDDLDYLYICDGIRPTFFYMPCTFIFDKNENQSKVRSIHCDIYSREKINLLLHLLCRKKNAFQLSFRIPHHFLHLLCKCMGRSLNMSPLKTCSGRVF